MADKRRLSVLLLATVLAWEFAPASSSYYENHRSVTIECGPTPNIPTNITVQVIASNSRHLVGLYTKGTQLRQCHSKLRRRGQSYLHVITDVFGRDCGAKLEADGTYSITVYLKYLDEREESTQTLLCNSWNESFSTENHFQQPIKRDILQSSFLHSDAHQTRNERPTSDVRIEKKHPLNRKVKKPDTNGNTLSSYRNKRSSSDRNDQLSSDENGKIFPKQRPGKSSQKDISHDVSAVTTSPSVLQLNVIDKDGNMTTIVFPGKQVALELHTSHHTPFGVPVVRKCKVTNPLEDNYIETLQPFQAVIIEEGCGLGDLLPLSSSFVRGRQGYATPLFPVPSGWTLQTALIFSCDVIICADVRQCHQTCPVPKKKVSTPELYDVTVELESQVVTSCPPIDENVKPSDVHWSDLLLPECLPEGHRLQNTNMPPEQDQNFTIGAAGNDVKTPITPSPSSWLAGHLHYVIIIAILALLIIVFMFATFCKMAAMQKQVERNYKMSGERAQRERAASESQHDQTTQTPRPLPRVPPGRGQTPNRQSRQGGDGAPTTTVVHADGDVPAARPVSGGTPYLGYDNLHESFNAATIPHARAFAQTRPKPYDIPPSHRDRHASETGISPDFAPIANERTPLHSSSFRRHSGEPVSLPRHDSPRQPSSEVKSFQTTVEEKNSERHTTIIEIKTPSKADATMDSGSHGWKGHQRLGSFTGNSSANTLERGVVLGVNSLRRHMDRDHQHQPMAAQHRDREQHPQPMLEQNLDRDQHPQPMAAQPRDRRPITAQNCDPIASQVFYNTPAPCSEDSTLKELFKSSPHEEGGGVEQGGFAGIRTSPHSGSRKGVTPVSPVAVNMVEETTRL